MARISHVTMGAIDYGWIFDIRSIGEFTEWQEQRRNSELKEEFRDAIAHGDHGVTPAGNAAVFVSEAKGIGLAYAICELEGERTSGMIRSLMETGHVFVMPSGGYFSKGKGVKIKETKKIPVWSFQHNGFSESDIRIIKWPGGKHYYAKIKDIDVVRHGEQKWNTEALARRAAKLFLKTL